MERSPEVEKAMHLVKSANTEPAPEKRKWLRACRTLYDYAVDLETSLEAEKEANQKLVLEIAKQQSTSKEVDRCYASGKVIFGSESQARRAMRSKHRPLRCYQCPDCLGWHLSKK